jgi:beta-mannosidase
MQPNSTPALTSADRALVSTRPNKVKLLDGEWALTATNGPVPNELAGVSIAAHVPGSVHTDLLAAGLIPDPYLDGNEAAVSWIGCTDWQYSTRFFWDLHPDELVELAFAGLDTIAEIRLNGTFLGSTQNMHRSYRFAAGPLLADGENILVVQFSAPIPYGDAASLELGYRPHANRHPYNAIRKMACSFGWDWGIDTSTSGIWKPVTIESYCVARIESARPVASVNEDGVGGSIAVHVKVARAADTELELSITVEGHSASLRLESGQTETNLTVDLPQVERWWPRGYGEQRLYDLVVTLKGGAPVDRSHRVDLVNKRVGFRTVHLDMTPDEIGTPFVILVNDRPIYVKGANWIPDDAFPHRVDRERYARRIEQAEFAGLNLIRVWGGGIYEAEDFYDLCDERGLLTWQDFLLACAAYAEEEPLYSEFEAEAREAVARIGAHPSMVIFNGNNENVWGHADWNWPLRLDGKTWGAKYYYELFPSIVAELAPQVGYTPSSPFSPNNADTPNDPLNGTMHIWDLWNQKDYPHFRDYAPRFVAEFGWQGPPTWATLTESITDNPLTPESPGMLVHQKATDGNNKLTDGLLSHFPMPSTMEDWHWAMSLNQAVAIKTAVEYFRSLTPYCSGSIVWQLNDCWPVTSWAAVDGYGRAKPLLHALRQAHQNRLVTVQPHTEGLRVVVINDTDTKWTSALTMTRYDYAGVACASEEIAVKIPPRGVMRVPIPAPVASAGQSASELIRASVDNHVGNWFFSDYRDSQLPEAKLTFELEQTEGGYLLTARAHTLVRDLTVLVDKVVPDACVDVALITLLPGESVNFSITTDHPIFFEDLTSPGVTRSANQLIRTHAV